MSMTRFGGITGQQHQTLAHKSYSHPADEASSSRNQQQKSTVRNLKRQLSTGTACFFGIASDDSTMQKWAWRHMRHCSRRYGFHEPMESEMEQEEIGMPKIRDPLAGSSMYAGGDNVRQQSRYRTMSISSRMCKASKLRRRQSVAVIAWDRISTLLGFNPSRATRTAQLHRYFSRSFCPSSLTTDDTVFENERPLSYSGELTDTAMVTDAVVDSLSRTTAPTGRSLAQVQEADVLSEREFQTDSCSDGTSGLKDMPFQSHWLSEERSLDNEVFFNASSLPKLFPCELPAAAASERSTEMITRHDTCQHVVIRPSPFMRMLGKRRQSLGGDMKLAPLMHKASTASTASVSKKASQMDDSRSRYQSAKSTISKLWSRAYSRHASRRVPGEGVVSKIFNRSFRQMSDFSPNVSMQLEEYEDYRYAAHGVVSKVRDILDMMPPYFTYWVTTVQLLVMIMAVATYGFGPWGFDRRAHNKWVLQRTLVLEQMSYFEQENLWLGPSYANLIHLGAKYAPCMRRDVNIDAMIEANRRIENETACCIFSDGTGCYQSQQSECSPLLAEWRKWTVANPGPDNRVSGSVCGQDPRECLKPASVNPFLWPDDLTRWPICTESSKTRSFVNTRCEISGRPCCIGIQGECRITTREYCDFVKGYFHEEATLCSQVSCLGQVCGMIPFVHEDSPDQFGRLFISLFLHAGLIHCAITVAVQFVIMRDLERLIGWFRISFIYFMSGIVGNLASAVFVPYHPEVGPSGSHFGLLAGLIVEVVYAWRRIRHPWKALAQLLLPLCILFCTGLLPWIDNYAHLFGFMVGFVLSLALFPFIQFNRNDYRVRLLIVVTTLVLFLGIFAPLIVLFFFVPLSSCELCVYLNCIQLTDHFCDNKGLELIKHPI